jgi:hypothetical protein
MATPWNPLGKNLTYHITVKDINQYDIINTGFWKQGLIIGAQPDD